MYGIKDISHYHTLILVPRILLPRFHPCHVVPRGTLPRRPLSRFTRPRGRTRRILPVPE